MKRGFEVVSKYKERGVKLPVRMTKNAAGYDFFAAEDFYYLVFGNLIF